MPDTKIDRSHEVRLFNVKSVAAEQAFIGRETELDECTIKLKSLCNIHIRGLPNTGKTSLALKLKERSRGWSTPETHFIFVYVNASSCESFEHLWREAANKLAKELKDHNINNDIKRLLDSVIATEDGKYSNIKSNVESLFEYLRTLGKHIILCIDSFDRVETIFKRDGESRVKYFSFMADLFQNPTQFGVTAIIISRKSLYEIEKQADGGSFLTHVVSKLEMQISRFTENDLNIFRSYAVGLGITLSDNDWESVVSLAGRSPYMLSVTMNAIMTSSETNSIAEALVRADTQLCEYFEMLLNYLREYESRDLKSFAQLFFGPMYNLSQDSINGLESAGYAFSTRGKARYVTLSTRFKEYIENEARQELDGLIWPKLGELETKMRKLIQKSMGDIHGPNWENRLREDFQIVDGINDDVASRIHKYFRNFSRNRDDGIQLTDTLYFRDYERIITRYWDIMRDNIKMESGRLSFALGKINRVRNRYAHNTQHLLRPREVSEVDLLCDEILESIQLDA